MFSNTHPLAKMIVPFVRTPTNILRYTFERTPGLALASREVRAALGRGGIDAAETMAKMELGAAMMGVTAYLASQGYITGPGSQNPVLQGMLKGEGFQPWALHIPGTDQTIGLSRGDPVSNFLIQGAILAQTSGAAPEGQHQEAVAGTLLGFMKAYKDKSFLTGFSNVVDLLSGRGDTATDAMKGPTKALTRFVQGLEPSLLRQLARAIDPEVREAETVLEGLMAVTPGVSATLAPSRNTLAQPVLYAHGAAEGMVNGAYRFAMPFPLRKTEQLPANHLLLENGLDLSKPSRTLEHDVRMTNAEYDAYQVLARDGLKLGGKTFVDRLTDWYDNAAFRKLSPGPEGEQSLRIRALAHQYQDLARRVMVTPGRPEFQQELFERVQDARKTAMGQRRGTVEPSPQEPALEQALRSLSIGGGR
jgi:hypothetical protein